MTQIDQRLNRVADIILNNEALTADLDDETAQVLLNWGLDLARQIVAQTQELDDAAAEAQMEPQLKAVRRALRLINRWLGESLDLPAETQSTYLSQLIEQAAVIYSDRFTPPAAEHQAAFIAAPKETTLQLIADLRRLLEPPGSTSPDAVSA